MALGAAEGEAVVDCAAAEAHRTMPVIKNEIELWLRRRTLSWQLIRQFTSANLNRPMPGHERIMSEKELERNPYS